jgi:DNA repair protein RecO (recombination protein O)
VLRLFSDGEPNPAAYNLLCRELALLDAEPSAASVPNLLAFRLKLLLAAGFLPELEACAQCGAGEGIVRFSPSAGGLVCGDCPSSDGFDLGAAAHSFMAVALGSPLQSAPGLDGAARRQVDRVVTGTLEHHAHVQLRSVV